MQTVVIALCEGVIHLDFSGPRQLLAGEKSRHVPGAEWVVDGGISQI